MIRNTRSNHIIYINNCNSADLVIQTNQRIHKLIVSNCSKCKIQVLDSVVMTTREAEFFNCTECQILFDCVDIRTIHAFNLQKCIIQFSDFETLIENANIYWFNCGDNEVQRTHIQKGVDPNKYIALPVSIVKSFPVTNMQKDKLYVSQLVGGVELETKEANIKNLKSDKDILKEISEGEETNKLFEKITNEQLSKFYISRHLLRFLRKLL